MSRRVGSGFGGGKVILVGEHAVVHGHPAIAARVSRGVEARARVADEDALHVEPWNVSIPPDPDSPEPLARAFAAVLARHADRLKIGVLASVALPAGAGLGCSAALGVSVIEAVDSLLGHSRPRAELAALALDWEREFHGNPSGIDNTTAALGGFLRFRRGEPTRAVCAAEAIHVVIAESGEKSPTKLMVDHVARRRGSDPAHVDGLLHRVGRIVDEAEHAIRCGDLGALGEAFDENHRVLSELGLSTPSLERLRVRARESGALGTKVTGAGGGGCILALAEDAPHAIRVRDAFRANAFIEEIGNAA